MKYVKIEFEGPNSNGWLICEEKFIEIIRINLAKFNNKIVKII